MQPYTLVKKDHRTNVENGNVTAVLDGDLDMFINAYLKYVSGGEKEERYDKYSSDGVWYSWFRCRSY